jgi:hypothetical protein
MLVKDSAPECINGELAALAGNVCCRQEILGKLWRVEDLLEGDLALAAIDLCGCAQCPVAMNSALEVVAKDEILQFSSEVNVVV